MSFLNRRAKATRGLGDVGLTAAELVALLHPLNIGYLTRAAYSKDIWQRWINGRILSAIDRRALKNIARKLASNPPGLGGPVDLFFTASQMAIMLDPVNIHYFDDHKLLYEKLNANENLTPAEKMTAEGIISQIQSDIKKKKTKKYIMGAGAVVAVAGAAYGISRAKKKKKKTQTKAKGASK